jgi:hypothetical protein
MDHRFAGDSFASTAATLPSRAPHHARLPLEVMTCRMLITAVRAGRDQGPSSLDRAGQRQHPFSDAVQEMRGW